MYNNEFIDIFGLVTEEESNNTSEKKMSSDEALIDFLNTKNSSAVDLNYIAERCGLNISQVISELSGAIYQQPEVFVDTDEYDETIGWVISSKYFSGNMRDKIAVALEMNLKFPGKFQKNIDELKKILPLKVGIDDIHLSLGASWVPVEEISQFIAQLLNLREMPEVVFYEDLKVYKVIKTAECKKSILNTITYGVREELLPGYDSYAKQYLTAIDIIEQTLNAKTIKVFDYIPKSNGGWLNYEYEAVLNKNKTIEAQNKQKAIIDAFKDYVYANKARITRFEDYYNDAMVGYTY